MWKYPVDYDVIVMGAATQDAKQPFIGKNGSKNFIAHHESRYYRKNEL